MSMMMGGGSKPKGAIVEFVHKKKEDAGADDVGLRICMEELMDAIKSGDVEQAMAAFKAAMAECTYNE